MVVIVRLAKGVESMWRRLADVQNAAELTLLLDLARSRHQWMFIRRLSFIDIEPRSDNSCQLSAAPEKLLGGFGNFRSVVYKNALIHSTETAGEQAHGLPRRVRNLRIR